MVDMTDLKSVGHCARGDSSSPSATTIKQKLENIIDLLKTYTRFFYFIVRIKIILDIYNILLIFMRVGMVWEIL